ncbi:hypothetical protein [Georgenia wangjunii]|uniref:hypothetical protein n=1 Tax=Georgenia wangjunii TaxID=3117730 RepID=UPI002F25F104
MTSRTKLKMVVPVEEATIGDLRPSHHDVTSEVERAVRQLVKDAGFALPRNRMAVVCRHPDKDYFYLLLTPDLLLVEHKIAIEVDPCNPVPDGRFFTHRGAEQKDRLRNELLAEAGWSVIRIRLGANKGMHIGPRDVIVESSTVTKAAAAAVLEAVDDAVHDRPAHVRLVKKGKTPTRAGRRSHVANIGKFKYSDDGHIFTWYPDLEDPKGIKLRLSMGGRYMCDHYSRERAVIAEAGLHEIAREQWKDRLTELLSEVGPPPWTTTKWPWGETLLVPQDGQPADVVTACERKATIDDIVIAFTVSGSNLAGYDAAGLYSADESPVALLHKDASAVGYRIERVVGHSGRYGGYHEVVISRPVGEP